MSYKIMRSLDGKFACKKGLKISWGKGYEYTDLNKCNHVIHEILNNIVSEIRSAWGELYIVTVPKFEVPVETTSVIYEQVRNKLNTNQSKLVHALLNLRYPEGIRSKQGLLRETGLTEEDLMLTIESLKSCISINDDRFQLKYDILLNNYSA